MKTILTIGIIIFAFAIVRWVLGDGGPIHVAELLPFVGGHPFGIYDLGGICMLVIIVLALPRLGDRDE